MEQTDKCCKHIYMFKDNCAFCFPESSFGVTSTKLYRANAGTADLYTLNSSVCIYNIQFVFVVSFVSSVFSPNLISVRLTLKASGVHCPGT